jgi:hypothetical protein
MQAEQEERDGPKLTQRKRKMRENNAKADAQQQAKIVHLLRRAWGYDDDEKRELEEELELKPVSHFNFLTCTFFSSPPPPPFFFFLSFSFLISLDRFCDRGSRLTCA